MVGSEGPATIVNSVIGEEAEVASGYVAGSVLLGKARIGSNGHVRPGTLLEEEASTAHAVGLKHTILMSFVTLGSLINCCDCLISGGRLAQIAQKSGVDLSTSISRRGERTATKRLPR